MSERIEKEFGTRVRQLRERAGLSSREFSLLIGRSKAYIIQLENGRRNVSLDTIERIAAGLGVTVSELFSGIDTHVDPRMHALDNDRKALNVTTPPPRKHYAR